MEIPLLKDLANFSFLIYGACLTSIYFLGIFLANRGIFRSKRRNVFLRSKDVISASDLPHVTLIAPAYNEGPTIIDNVLSLLLLKYPYYDLIVVNDGSSDDSLEKLIHRFKLVPTEPESLKGVIPTAKLRNVYKSTLSHYTNLTVVDKENGGRSDAVNAGINIASSELILCTDADCIIEENAIIKMVTPFLDEEGKEIIACGGGIGVANGSVIENGVLKKLKLPRNLLGRIQVVEYIRAFLLGRMAWGEVNGLLLVSGAFGMYPRQRLMEIGGFDTNTIGEDFELCVRLRRHMENLKKPYKVIYLPLTLCWTEAPDNYSIFVKQRDRWARGLWETLKTQGKLIGNPNYRAMGMLFLPYWVIFEFGAPLIEFAGLLYLLLSGYMGWLNWEMALNLFLFVYLLGCLFSTAAVFMYVNNFNEYNNFRHISGLLIAAYLEPLVFHPVLVFASIKGYYKMLFNIKSGWGTMTRKGFAQSS
ncbi:glycosyltransferase family 2 protein [Salegentibacter sediminis]|uniref:glycosyltransferase family 2 protein n=1 Tax=Salegentibacter sediminis TaxID=1930251 RepID=UPI0009C14DF6|nr:glycosyltransferase [Salegentibacter sediminis]